jgi:hypothetical protein
MNENMKRMELIDETYLINNNRLYTLNYIKIVLIIKEYSKKNMYIDKHIISRIVTLVRWCNEVIKMPFNIYNDLVTNENPEIIKYVKYQYYDLCEKNVRKNGLMLKYIKCQSFELCTSAYYNNPSCYSFVNDYYFQRSMYFPTIHPQTKDYYDRLMVYNTNDNDESENDESENDESENDESENDESDNDNLENDNLENDDLENDNLKNDDLKNGNPENNNEIISKTPKFSNNDLGFALTGHIFIQCQVCRSYCNSSCNKVEYGMCIKCAESNVIEKDLHVLSLNNGLPLTYLCNDIINYGYCHRCGIKNEKIFCDQCTNQIKETKNRIF